MKIDAIIFTSWPFTKNLPAPEIKSTVCGDRLPEFKFQLLQ